LNTLGFVLQFYFYAVVHCACFSSNKNLLVFNLLILLKLIVLKACSFVIVRNKMDSRANFGKNGKTKSVREKFHVAEDQEISSIRRSSRKPAMNRWREDFIW